MNTHKLRAMTRMSVPSALEFCLFEITKQISFNALGQPFFQRYIPGLSLEVFTC
jgi:hypothetical protein